MAHPGSVAEFQLELIQLLGLDQERCISIDLSLRLGELPTLRVETVVSDLDKRVEEWKTITRFYCVTGIGKLVAIPLAQNKPEDKASLQSS